MLATCLVATVAAAGFAAVAAGADESGPEMLIRFEPGAERDERAEALEAIGGEVVRAYGLVPGLRLVQLPPGASVRISEEQLDSIPAVDFSEADTAMRIDRSPDDPLLFRQWGLAAIEAPSAWDTTTGTPNVAVAVLDTGMDLDHPDLAENLWSNPGEIPENGVDDDSNGFVDDAHGWDFANGDSVPDDDQGHGTHTAGIIGAVGDNGTGVSGVAWDVALVPLKICSAAGRCRVSDAIAALEYAVDNGISISSNSYGFGGNCPVAFGTALSAAGGAGHLFVTSAGNEGRDIDSSPKYPAACREENVLTVAWLANERQLASKSNYGARQVDIAAPGSAIHSTLPGGLYGSRSGTSMAAPHAAGTAALLEAVEPSGGWSGIKERIRSATRRVCGLPVAFEGTLDAGAALSGISLPAQDCPGPPEIVSGPPSRTNQRLASFEFTGNPDSTFRCSLDGGPWEACTPPVEYSVSTEGSHSFRVQQAVGDGPESVPSVWSWTVDTTAPLTPSITGSPESPTTRRSATFLFSGESGATFRCRLSGGPAEECRSPFTVADLEDGPHSLTVFQTDRAGNDSRPARLDWTVDTTPPSRPFIETGPTDHAGGSVDIAFSGESGATLECHLHGPASGQESSADGWRPCVSPLLLTGLVDGPHRIVIRQRDQAGNQSIESEIAWTVDTRAPEAPVVTGGPVGLVRETTARFRVTGEPGARNECLLTGVGNWVSCGSRVLFGPLADGTETASFRQIDRAGNVSPVVSRSWQIDATAPRITTANLGKNGRDRYRISVRATDRGSGLAAVELSSANRPDRDSGPDRRLVWNGQINRSLRITRAPVWIRVTDRAGNRSAWFRLADR